MVMAPPPDANRVTRQLGREPPGQVGQTWLHIRTIVQRRHLPEAAGVENYTKMH
jgi:hypothetical protein